jgi:hypothetical protein
MFFQLLDHRFAEHDALLSSGGFGQLAVLELF